MNGSLGRDTRIRTLSCRFIAVWLCLGLWAFGSGQLNASPGGAGMLADSGAVSMHSLSEAPKTVMTQRFNPNTWRQATWQPGLFFICPGQYRANANNRCRVLKKGFSGFLGEYEDANEVSLVDYLTTDPSNPPIILSLERKLDSLTVNYTRKDQLSTIDRERIFSEQGSSDATTGVVNTSIASSIQNYPAAPLQTTDDAKSSTASTTLNASKVLLIHRLKQPTPAIFRATFSLEQWRQEPGSMGAFYSCPGIYRVYFGKVRCRVPDSSVNGLLGGLRDTPEQTLQASVDASAQTSTVILEVVQFGRRLEVSYVPSAQVNLDDVEETPYAALVKTPPPKPTSDADDARTGLATTESEKDDRTFTALLVVAIVAGITYFGFVRILRSGFLQRRGILLIDAHAEEIPTGRSRPAQTNSSQRQIAEALPEILPLMTSSPATASTDTAEGEGSSHAVDRTEQTSDNKHRRKVIID